MESCMEVKGREPTWHFDKYGADGCCGLWQTCGDLAVTKTTVMLLKSKDGHSPGGEEPFSGSLRHQSCAISNIKDTQHTQTLHTQLGTAFFQHTLLAVLKALRRCDSTPASSQKWLIIIQIKALTSLCYKGCVLLATKGLYTRWTSY